MKSNGLLKWLSIPAALAVVFLLVQLFSNPSTSPTEREKEAGALTEEESKQLGVDADSPRDTVATLVAQVKELRVELRRATEDNAKQKADNERLRLREGSLDQRIETALTAERAQRRQDQERSSEEMRETQTLLEELTNRVESMRNKGTHSPDLPIGLGLEDQEGSEPQQTSTRWIEPQDAPPAKPGGRSSNSDLTRSASSFPTQFGAAQAPSPARNEAVGDSSDVPHGPSSAEASSTAVYTAPENSTLLNSVAMTALVGRIPADGTVADPYPFKVLVGADTLIANGYELPELAGAVMSGTATGDWTLSCVRGQIHSVTFVFDDGSIRTISSNARKSGASRTADDGIGWLSDPYGIPCVTGRQVSNAKQYLTTQMLVTAAGAGAAAAIDSENSRLGVVSAQNGSALGTVGITGNEALQRILAGGVQEISRWAERLYGQAHAAIVVPPMADVVVHLEQPLEIDIEHGGRKVHHQPGGNNAAELD